MSHRLPPHLSAAQQARYIGMLESSPGYVTPLAEASTPDQLPPHPAGHRRCVHVGEPVGSTSCRTCSGQTEMPTRLCQLHNVECVTSLRQPVGELRWCLRCPDHEPVT
jgi:hypothetical protein